MALVNEAICQSTDMPSFYPKYSDTVQGFFQQFWERAPGQNWEKLIDLTTKLGEINDIEHNKGSKISSKSSYFRLYYAKHTYHLSTSV